MALRVTTCAPFPVSVAWDEETCSRGVLGGGGKRAALSSAGMSIHGCSVILMAGRDSKWLGSIPGCAHSGSLDVIDMLGLGCAEVQSRPLPRLGN